MFSDIPLTKFEKKFFFKKFRFFDFKFSLSSVVLSSKPAVYLPNTASVMNSYVFYRGLETSYWQIWGACNARYASWALNTKKYTYNPNLVRVVTAEYFAKNLFLLILAFWASNRYFTQKYAPEPNFGHFRAIFSNSNPNFGWNMPQTIWKRSWNLLKHLGEHFKHSNAFIGRVHGILSKKNEKSTPRKLGS